MKNVYKLMASAIVLVACSTNSFAQNSATDQATATATIVTPITLVNTGNMEFGSIVANGAVGTVILSPAGGLTTSGVTVLAGATPSAATFTVTGDANFTYSVVLPADNAVTLALTGQTPMALTDFTTDATALTALTGGTSDFSVGAKLHVGVNQVAGVYVSSNFDVTVNYN